MLHSEHRGLNTYRPVSPTSVVCETSKQSLKEKNMKNMKVYTLNRINCSSFAQYSSYQTNQFPLKRHVTCPDR